MAHFSYVGRMNNVPDAEQPASSPLEGSGPRIVGESERLVQGGNVDELVKARCTQSTKIERSREEDSMLGSSYSSSGAIVLSGSCPDLWDDRISVEAAAVKDTFSKLATEMKVLYEFGLFHELN